MEVIVKAYARPSLPIVSEDGFIYYENSVYFVAGPLGNGGECYDVLRVSGSAHRYCKFFNPKRLLKHVLRLYESLEEAKLYELDWDEDILPTIALIAISHDSSAEVSVVTSHYPLVGEFRVDKDLMDYLFGDDWEKYNYYNYRRVFDYFKNLFEYSTF